MNKSLEQNNEGLFETTNGPVPLQELIETARDTITKNLRQRKSISNPSDATDYFYTHLVTEKREVFAVLFLDNQHKVIRFERMFLGTINASSVHPREVVKKCLELNAAAVILGHNHPSGVTEPSISDVDITSTLKEALNLIDVRILDHLIVGGGGTTSMAELGKV